jgi:hypothetical protein
MGMAHLEMAIWQELLGEAFLSIVILVLFLLIILLGMRLISMEKRLAKLAPIDAGQKNEAIKRYREVMSVSLAEAKPVIEQAQRRAGLQALITLA